MPASRRSKTDGDTVEVALDILDRQLLDISGKPCGKVDDLLLEFPDESPSRPPVVTHILVSPGALAPRVRGIIGKVMLAVWRRLHPDKDPKPVAIAWSLVEKVDTDVHLMVLRGEAGLMRSEDWARDNFIGRIPGAG